MTVSYDKLWKLMKANKMKKSELARAAEISQYTMTKLNNDRLVSMEIMLRLCKIFHCDIGDPNVSEDALFAAFKKIDKVVAPERKKAKGDLWSNMTMLVDADGNMHTDFDYTDLSSGTYQFKKAWKKKYLV